MTLQQLQLTCRILTVLVLILVVFCYTAFNTDHKAFGWTFLLLIAYGLMLIRVACNVIDEKEKQ